MNLQQILVFGLVAILAGCQRPDPNNSVAVYLTNAERQVETEDQKQEIRRALRDLLEKPPEELRRIRYADYSGKPEQWTAIDVLKHYFVPEKPASLDEETFYRDVRARPARDAIETQLANLR